MVEMCKFCKELFHLLKLPIWSGVICAHECSSIVPASDKFYDEKWGLFKTIFERQLHTHQKIRASHAASKMFFFTSSHRLELAIAERRFLKYEVEHLGHTASSEEIVVSSYKTLLPQATRPSSKAFAKNEILKYYSWKYLWKYQQYFFLWYPYWILCSGMTAWKRCLKIWTLPSVPASVLFVDVV